MTRIDFVRARLSGATPTGSKAIAYACILVALPTIIRVAIDPAVAGVAYVTYYPLILWGALLLNWRRLADLLSAGTIAGGALQASTGGAVRLCPQWEPKLGRLPNGHSGTATRRTRSIGEYEGKRTAKYGRRS
jgi:hypothetical protein